MNREAAFQVHSEARGPHWVAWITRQGDANPYRSVLLVGASQDEAEARARKWGEMEAQIVNSSASS
jgi:hypothetical protein